MADFLLTAKYKVNTNKPISAGELKQRHFFGIPVIDTEGNLIADSELEFHINSAIKELETELSIVLPLKVIVETKDFRRENYQKWGNIKATYPVVCIGSVQGFVGTVRQVIYPQSWLSVQQSNDEVRHRGIHIVPNAQGNTVDYSAAFAGIYPQLGYYGNRDIPNYWQIQYVTGFLNLPEDLLKVVGMKASIPIFDLLGDIVIGAGIASQSLGLDGLSQSINTTSSAENSAYSARIKSYLSQLKELMPGLKKKYAGIIFTTA
jgi:hypothetical protein